ncbi:MAG TPA: peroxiredoxin [Ktedonobacterales bacterium]|nr:peroxiredoxin [Ktedonobacterales bacterium]
MSNESSTTARVGAPAPDFTLPDQSGTPVRLGDFIGKRVVVLYFYPMDETPGCTAEACSFRDSYEDFTRAGAEVIGVSGDSVGSHQRFAAHHQLPFTLLSDAGGKVAKLYDVQKTLGLFPGRVTFVIDRQGVIRHAFSSATQIDKHISAAAAIVRQLAAEAS